MILNRYLELLVKRSTDNNYYTEKIFVKTYIDITFLIYKIYSAYFI